MRTRIDPHANLRHQTILSEDLRLRVLAAVDSGRLREEVAQTFCVSVPTINVGSKGAAKPET